MKCFPIYSTCRMRMDRQEVTWDDVTVTSSVRLTKKLLVRLHVGLDSQLISDRPKSVCNYYFFSSKQRLIFI